MSARFCGVHGRPVRLANPCTALAPAVVGLLALAAALPAATAQDAFAAASTASGSSPWSATGTVAAGCNVVRGPVVAFPSRSPRRATGPGALVWAGAGCPRAAGGKPGGGGGSTVAVAPLAASDVPIAARTGPLPGAFGGTLQAVGASFGRVAIGAGVAGSSKPDGEVTVLESLAAEAPPAPAFSQQGAPFAMSRAYLGDVALATVAGQAISVRIQRYFQHSFGPVRVIPIRGGRVTSLTATMDYRSDVLLAWQQNGSIYAHMLRASGRPDPTQRVGPSAPGPQLQALVSDNDHGTIAWSTRVGGGARRTRIYLDLSAAEVRFSAPLAIATFGDPARVWRTPGSLAMVRLAGENAVLAWTAAEHGRYVVRASPTVAASKGESTRLSDARTDAVLAALAPGPAGEAIAAWASPAGSGPAPTAARTLLWAARTILVPRNRLVQRAPQLVAAEGGAPGAVGLGVDPANDRVLLAWRSRKDPRAIEYAIGRGAPPAGVSALAGHAHRGRSSDDGPPWAAIALAGAGALALVALALGGRSARRRRAAPPHSR